MEPLPSATLKFIIAVFQKYFNEYQNFSMHWYGDFRIETSDNMSVFFVQKVSIWYESCVKDFLVLFSVFVR